MSRDDGVDTNWYVAGEASINAGAENQYVVFPPVVIVPSDDSRKAPSPPTETEILRIRESEQVFWHYGPSGVVLFSSPTQLEQSKPPSQQRPRGKYEKKYESVRDRGYGISPSNDRDKVTGWQVGLPKTFFPELYKGQEPLVEAVPEKAALEDGTTGWIVFTEEMMSDSPYTGILLRRREELVTFLSSVIRRQDGDEIAIDVIDAGVQGTDAEDLRQKITQNLADDINRTPHLI